LGPNPHYPYKAPKTQAVGTTVGVTTDWKEVKTDGDIAKPAAKKEALAQVDCNPCYTSNTGPNTHYDYKGNAGAKPFGSTSPPVAAKDDKKDDDKKEGLAQMDTVTDCNPCYQSNLGKNPHYANKTPPPKMSGYQPGQDPSGGEKPVGAAAAGGDKKDEKKKDALAQASADADADSWAWADLESEEGCNPCYKSNNGKNPHYGYAGAAPAGPGYQPGADPSGGEKMIMRGGDGKKDALAQMDTGVDCNPCPQSNLGKNPHYASKAPPPKMSGYQPGKDPAGGEKMAAAAGAEGDKKDEKKAALAQVDCNPCYQSNLGPNTHYDYPGNKKAVPFGKTVAAPAKKEGDDKKDDKKEGLAQMELPAYNVANLGAYAQVIQDAAENNAPEVPITY